MTQSDWPKSDYETAWWFIEENEAEASQHPVLDCGKAITAIIPLGTLAFGVRPHGIIMLAPLVMFMLCAALVPWFVLTGDSGITLTSLAVALICLGLLWGLTRVAKMVLSQRELFPRKFFVTLSPEGIAMHFSMMHFPFRSNRTALKWKDVDSIQAGTQLFLPALFLGKPSIPVLHAHSKQGACVTIPAPTDPNAFNELQALLKKRSK